MSNDPVRAEHSVVSLNGLDYFLRDEGPQDGKPVLLLHGMPDDGELWRAQINALVGAGYRALCPDLLAYGKTVAPDEVARYSTDSIALDMLALLDQLSLPKVHVAGHDWGGALAWSLIIGAPERLTSATVLSIGHPGAFSVVDFSKMRWNWYMFLQANPGVADIYRANDGKLFREVVRSHPHRDQVIERYMVPGRMEKMLRWDQGNPVSEMLMAQAMGAFDELPPVSVPVMGIWSDGDEFLWEEQMTGTEKYMAAPWRYEKIEGASHWLMLDQPAAVSDLLLDWIDSH